MAYHGQCVVHAHDGSNEVFVGEAAVGASEGKGAFREDDDNGKGSGNDGEDEVELWSHLDHPVRLQLVPERSVLAGPRDSHVALQEKVRRALTANAILEVERFFYARLVQTTGRY